MGEISYFFKLSVAEQLQESILEFTPTVKVEK